ncbi:aminodeoxychorismate synthase glutamine amidotransferase subunit [Haloarcula quadrata]|jgi:anthranilate synthase component 2|uniref:Anthranilate synthase component II n=2 Tax=Haloarcula TaxID=2237 RepID=Q5V447_HALMA|nr:MULTISPECIES: aminodeoxychorismate/anthranilate synthase component II [Haloarcula]AAV45705.1 anthranilate synthase component II [Haloarcula marismortui ATCC 43049]NHN62791.1 aminodeoxychorismate/anthranilate synthase component II [Haloarcula sp. JP-Z28]QCP90482.1 aminodeoxychorismate/anthranilate synthase component II [Haloarcula marismortui ATCC 43049]RKS82449.1 aminodeoxychorismate synthase glutamine amidotransferase subunit [Haloarcula quadrata]
MSGHRGGDDSGNNTAGGPATDSLAPTVLVIDNYDSFAYNLVQYVGEVVLRLGGTEDDVVVRRNDAIAVEGIREMDPDGIVVSPGPGTPEDAGVSMPIFEELEYPTLGVCLGHQALCAANGAPVGHAEAVVHGKSSSVTHDGTGVFEDISDPFEVGRYHSLAVDRENLPDVLTETAYTVSDDAEAAAVPESADAATADGTDESQVVMGVRHSDRPHIGVQFHPESILTDHGKTMIENFCLLCNTT